MNEIETQAKRACQRAKLDYHEARDAYEAAYARPEPEESPDGTARGWEALCRERRDEIGGADSDIKEALKAAEALGRVAQDGPAAGGHKTWRVTEAERNKQAKGAADVP